MICLTHKISDRLSRKPETVDNSPQFSVNQALNPPTPTPTPTPTSTSTSTSTSTTPPSLSDGGGSGDVEQSRTHKSKTPALRAGVQEAGQKSDEALRNVNLADCCSAYQPELATVAAKTGLDHRGAQKLCDALAGALQAPEGDPCRLRSRDNPLNWLKTTAEAIKNGEFKENSTAYLSAVANRHAHPAARGSGGLTIEPGVYMTGNRSLVHYNGDPQVRVVEETGGARTISISQVVADVSAGRVTLTPVAPDAEAA